MKSGQSECAICILGRVSTPNRCPFHEVARSAGSLIFPQGEPPECVWFLRRGTVLLSSVSACGDETLCSLRGPGSLLGLELLRNAPTDYEAWALADVEMCRLESDGFRGWVGDRSTPMGVVLGIALEEASKRGQERLALAGRSVTRVARFLLERRRVEQCDRPLRVEKQVLARMLGMRAETLSRALARLREEGAIAAERDVHVIDPAVLAVLSGEDAGESANA